MNTAIWKYRIRLLGWWPAYRIYLASPFWKNKRKKRLKIDKNECRTCGEDGSSYGLQIHHKPQAYSRIPNECVYDDLITLCSMCHDAITNTIRARRNQSKNIQVPTYTTGKRSERTNFYVARIEVQFEERTGMRADPTQRRSSEPVKPFRERDEAVYQQKEQDRRRSRNDCSVSIPWGIVR